MNLDAVQAYAASQIQANTTLAAFGTPILVSYFTPDETARKTIQDRLRQYGVCIHVGPVGAEGDGEKPFLRYSVVDANFEVFVTEDPKTTHTPQEVSLAMLVAQAVQARVDARTPSARCIHYHSEVSEHGYVMHILSFQIPAEV